MIDLEKNDLDINFLKLLADNYRMAILYYLQNGEKSFKQIQEHLKKSQSIISSNLKLLTQETLIQSRTEAGSKYFSIRNPKIFELLQQISTFVVEKEQEKILTRSKNDASEFL
jgi:DNA-binding HxlR family transcriptional regulator